MTTYSIGEIQYMVQVTVTIVRLYPEQHIVLSNRHVQTYISFTKVSMREAMT